MSGAQAAQPNTTLVNVCYSLPRLVTMGIQCTYCTYFFELYIGEFGWSPPEFGVATSLYNFTQMFSFVGYGFLLKFVIDTSSKTIDDKLKESKYVLMAGTGVHWRLAKFFRCLFKPFKILGTLLASGHISGRNYLTPYEVTKIEDAERERKRWLLLDSSVRMGPTATELMDSVPDPTPDFDLLQQIWAMAPEPSPMKTPSCCINLLRFIFSRKFVVYILTIAHGLGVSAHELSNKAIEGYIYSNPFVSGATSMNLSFLFISNLVMYVVFLFAKLFVRSKFVLCETFFVLSILYMAFCAPALYYFYDKTQKVDAKGGGSETKLSTEKWVCLAFKAFSLTIWHAAVVFLIFSGGALTFFVGTFIMGGKSGVGTWGVLAIFGSLTGMSFLFMILTKASGPGGDTTQILMAGVCILGQSSVYLIFSSCSYILLIFTGIVNSVFVTYANIMLAMMLIGNSWKWIFFGFFYSGTNAAVFPSMLNMFKSFGQDQTRNVALGCIRFEYQYCFPTIYRLIAIIFQIASVAAYYIYGIAHNYQNQLDAAEDKVKQLKTLACEFKTQAGKVVQKANEFKDKAGESNGFLKKANEFSRSANAGKFKAAAQAYGGGAECAGSTESAAYKLKLFSQALVAAAEKFKKFGESLVTASTGSCDLLKKNAEEFAGAVTGFKDQARDFAQEADGSSGFLKKAQDFKQAAEAIPDITVDAIKQSSVQKAIQQFKLASRAFGGTGEASDKFHAFAIELQKIQASLTCQQLTALSGGFEKIAGTFKQKARQFKQQANLFAKLASEFSQESGGASATNFTNAAEAFLTAADTFKALAEGLANGLTGVHALQPTLEAFKQAASTFATEAGDGTNKFNDLAQAVQASDQADLEKIKGTFRSVAIAFKEAADLFDEDNGIGKTFEDVKKALSEASEKCNDLKDKAKAFKEAVDKQEEQPNKGFKQLAHDFKQSAQNVKVTDANGRAVESALVKFRNAAGHFQQAAAKLNTFADQLQTSITTCSNIITLAPKFAKIKSFQTQAKKFKDAVDKFQKLANNVDTYRKFRTAAWNFMIPAYYFQTLASDLAGDLAETPLAPQANDFQTKALDFYNDALEFYKLANKVGKDDQEVKEDLKQIQQTFQEAADAFQKAAEQFYKGEGEGTIAKAFDDFTKALSDANGKCSVLTVKTNEFNDHASEFRAKSRIFKTDADGIDNITETILKPSRVQLAISQFKLSAAKFMNAAAIFQTAAETFGNQGDSAAGLLGDFANTLPNTGATCDQIKTNADKFKEKAELFYTQATKFECAVTSFATEAEKFNDLAKLVKEEDDADLKTIATEFKSAAEKFGKVDTTQKAKADDGAAKKLFDAANKFGSEKDGVSKLFYDAVCKLVTGNACTP